MSSWKKNSENRRPTQSSLFPASELFCCSWLLPLDDFLTCPSLTLLLTLPVIRSWQRRSPTGERRPPPSQFFTKLDCLTRFLDFSYYSQGLVKAMKSLAEQPLTWPKSVNILTWKINDKRNVHHLFTCFFLQKAAKWLFLGNGKDVDASSSTIELS